MLHDRAAVERFEMRADVTGRFGFVFQHVKYPAAAAVRKRFENEIVIFFS